MALQKQGCDIFERCQTGGGVIRYVLLDVWKACDFIRWAGLGHYAV